MNTGRVVGGACLAGLLWAAPVQAQDFVAQANALYEDIKREDRSDLILLPVLAQMDPPPGVVATPTQAKLLPAGAPGWDAVVAWTTAAPQQAVLEALKTITADKDPRRGMAFGQPYGQAAGYEALSTGLYTDLGDPPLLSAAQFLFLPALQEMSTLVQAEVTRLAADGSPDEAVDMLIDWIFFARQMADRESFDEARWGYLAIIDGLERIRDVVYVDSLPGNNKITATQIKNLLDWAEDNRGALDIDRLNFPRAEGIAFEQILDVTYQNRGGPETDTFPSTLARLSAKKRPLQLFSSAARWEEAMRLHADYFAMRDEGRGCINDWADHRWRRNWHDTFLKEPSHIETLDPDRFAMLGALYTRQTPEGLIDFSALQHDRQRVLTEIVGTRTALALRGFIIANRRFPPVLSAVVPDLLPEIEADPYNPAIARGAKPPLEYFVPWTINDRVANERNVVKEPHEINIVLGDGFNFKRRVGEDRFILYSVGPNGGAEKARDVQNASELNPGDYLIWPPVLSLHRQYLREQGQFD